MEIKIFSKEFDKIDEILKNVGVAELVYVHTVAETLNWFSPN